MTGSLLSRHLLIIFALVLLLTAAMAYPFLPGGHDSLALTLSGLIQGLGVLGLLLVPIGIFWLAYEWRKQTRIRRNLPHQFRAHRFAVAALVLGTVPMLVVTVAAWGSVGVSLMLPVLALWSFFVAKLIPKVKRLKNAEPIEFNSTPTYLTLIPVALSLAQTLLARPLTDFSRNRAMANSAELIQAIERHREQHGRYPESLLALHPDYKTSVIGIDRYHYAPRGDAYDLFFEQPRFAFDDLGTRELVVYNKLDQHRMLSHAAWILESSPEQLMANQGWYSARETGRPHWKSFNFD